MTALVTAAGRAVLYAVAADSSSRTDSLKTETVTTRILDDLQEQGVIYLYVLIYEGYIYGMYVLFGNFQ